jgi:tetratricopeptide (TPR) repeat protein
MTRSPVALWRSRATDLAAYLLAVRPAEEQSRLVSQIAHEGGALLLAVAMLDAARLCDPANPERAAKLARLAADQVEPAAALVRPHLLALTHCRLADSLRRCRRLPEAELSLVAAFRVLPAIPADREARALYLASLALLRRDQGRRGAALALLERARRAALAPVPFYA